MNLLKHDQRYVIEVYPFGLLISAPWAKSGVPMDAPTQAAILLASIEGAVDEHGKEKPAGINSGIANALGGVFAVGTNDNLAKWERQITSDLEAQNISRDLKWIRGVDVGMSSTVIFITLTLDPQAAHEPLAYRCKEHGRQRSGDGLVYRPTFTPQDSDDLGRCIRLVEYMHWHDRIGEMRAISPAWDAIASQWDNLCALYKDGKHNEVYDILKGINATV